MKELKGKNVYTIMFNYCEKDYSLINIMSSLDSAFNYICKAEKAMFNCSKEYKLLRVDNQNDLNFDYQDKYVNICFVSIDDYNAIDIWDRMDISQFIIIPMKIQ